MGAQTQGFGRPRPPQPLPWASLKLEPPPRLTRLRPSRRGSVLKALVGFCLAMLAACSTVQQAPAVAPRPQFAPPRLVPPQLPEALPAPVEARRTVWRHDRRTPRLWSA